MICSESGSGMFCYKGVTNWFNKLSGTQRFIVPPDVDIKPIFKYPRRDYLGVRDTSK
jgi:hypothetical protein